MRSILFSRGSQIAICAMALAGAALASFKGGGQDQAPTVVNLTEALKVESFKRIQDSPTGAKSYTLTFKNVSGRRIVAWLVKGPDGTNVAVGMALNLDFLEANETHQVTVYDRGANNPGPNQVTIELVMFEDGSSEGDSKAHALLGSNRLESKIQIEKANKIMQAALSSRGATSDKSLKANKQWLKDLISQISQLPANDSMGASSVKEGILRDLSLLGEAEDARAESPSKAQNVLRQEGRLFGAVDLDDGIGRIIDHNRKLLEKSADKRRMQ